MKLIKPTFEILPQSKGLDGIYKQIEIAGRHCYKSEDKITDTSAKEFVKRMIKSEHCYTKDSEVLTENGWIKWELYNGERIATINADSTFKGFETPNKVIKHTYSGKFYNYPSLGITVTDEHNMFGIFRESKSDFYNNTSYNLFKSNSYFRTPNGIEKTLGERMFKTPRHCLKPNFTNPYGELIGFWLGDGCYCKDVKNNLKFHLKKERKIKYLQQLCYELGYEFQKKANDCYTVTSNNIGFDFNLLFYSNNGKKINIDYFPSIEMGHSIIQGLINSDGSLGTNTKTITFTNTSKSIIDWMLTYAPLCGYTISDRGVIKAKKTNHNIRYKILLLDTHYTINNDSRYKNTKVRIFEDDLDVYCVSVSTGLIMVRGINGVTTICGNCAMLEHGTVYLTHPIEHIGSDAYQGIGNKYRDNKFSKINYDHWGTRYITTNYRVLVENNWLKDLQYLCEPTEYHEKRTTVKFICDKGISHEFVRHRVFSFAQESTRYCNYSKDKFNNELTFIAPLWLDYKQLAKLNSSAILDQINSIPKDMEFGPDEQQEISYLHALSQSEVTYLHLLSKGWTPQQARAILPNSLKTELVMTGFDSDWEHFFKLRCDASAHPQARELSIPLYEEFIKLNKIK